MSLLEITDLSASVNGNTILTGVSLSVNEGEVHAIMGPNGSGKSTLSHVIAGREGYDIDSGTVYFRGEDVLNMEPEDRALSGIFLGFQYPIEIPGVSNMEFLKTAVDSHRKADGEEEMSAVEFMKFAREVASSLELNPDFLKRHLNVGFSGGEKKRNEVLQMLMLNPKLALLDESDSGLDVDAMKVVAQGINTFRKESNALLLITHYERLLEYVVPDFVHVFVDGSIVKSGAASLAREVEENGYGWVATE